MTDSNKKDHLNQNIEENHKASKTDKIDDNESQSLEDIEIYQMKINGLKNEKDLLEQQTKKLEEKIIKLAAENENIIKRYTKQFQEIRDFAIYNFAKDLLNINDNLSRSLQYVNEGLNEETKNIVEGIKLTQQDLMNVFLKHNIEIVEPKIGDSFDYSNSQIVSQVDSDEYDPETITEVLQVGYTLNSRLLRPASVNIVKKKK